MHWECIFQGSGDPNVKTSPFTAHHGGTSGDTDLANSKETQSLRKKMAVDRSALIKACYVPTIHCILLLYMSVQNNKNLKKKTKVDKN